MIKTVMAGAIAMAMVSFGANAAPGAAGAAQLSKNQGQGVVNFKGTVIDTPCGISPDSVDQSIDFGQISKSHLSNGGTSVQKNLDIKLVNCDISTASAMKSVSVTFSGANVGTQKNELGTSGGTGTAIVVSGADGKLVSFDGTSTNAKTQLKAGDNILHYSTWVKQATGGTISEGDFSAVANFNLTYE
ncbi:fimbrial protein [Escherichia coli]|nr:fimbrial protein [Escherichia coli]MDY9212523.1 fimbrial protein [Escherichia coli]MDY9267095.1 fimbrial protein [Escherichia coli]MDY9321878.1 fimbrial protein [Escherichia coli]MDY9326748.1 fimbrial protein [Escherichia coli]